MDFVVDFGCALQITFWKLMKILLLLPGLSFKDKNSLGTKQTQVEPNANRGWPIKLDNHIQPQLSRLCPKSSWTPASQNANGTPPYWGFQCYGIDKYAGVAKIKLTSILYWLHNQFVHQDLCIWWGTDITDMTLSYSVIFTINVFPQELIDVV